MAIKDYLKIKVFQSTKEMMLWHYIQYLNTNDIRYFSTFHEVLIPYPTSKKTIKIAMDNIFNEMVSDDAIVKNRIGIIHKIEKLKTKYYDVNRLVDAMLMNGTSKEMMQEFRKQLQRWGHKIVGNYEVLDQLYKIKTRNEALLSDIESLTIELEKTKQSEKIEIEEIIYNIEQGLEMKYKIDTKKTSLFEWDLMQKRISKKIDMLNKEKMKKK